MRDISKFQSFIVIKDFWKVGSACMGFAEDEDVLFRATLSKCLLIAKSPLQVVRLNGPSAECLEVYAEYAPYTFFDDPQALLDICISGECPGEINPLIVKCPWLKEQYEAENM